MTGPRLVLVGPPGAGKTTVGTLVAGRLGVPFRDTDRDVESAAGKTVAEIFLDDGEAAFRDLEAAAVRTALTEHEGVLALGGGAVLAETTRTALLGHRVVFLGVGLADAVARVGLARDRPVLGLNPRATMRAMLVARTPLYTEVARGTVLTDGRTVDDIAQEVITHAG